MLRAHAHCRRPVPSQWKMVDERARDKIPLHTHTLACLAVRGVALMERLAEEAAKKAEADRLAKSAVAKLTPSSELVFNRVASTLHSPFTPTLSLTFLVRISMVWLADADWIALHAMQWTLGRRCRSTSRTRRLRTGCSS